MSTEEEPNKTPAAPDREVLLIEYQAAQASAEHHDNLAWNVVSILGGSSLVLLGFVVGALGARALRVPLTIIALLGVALSLTVWCIAFQFNAIKNQKYGRCQEIERVLGMQQHISVTHKPGSQRKIGGAVMALLSLVWLLVIAWVWIS